MQTALPPPAGHQQDQGKETLRGEFLFHFQADYPVVPRVCLANPKETPVPQSRVKHYLGERKEELPKLLSPLHKGSGKRSASLPSP